VVVRGLFVVVSVADELLLGEGSAAEEGETGGQCAVSEAHGYGDGGKAGLRSIFWHLALSVSCRF
jgi:hypothetical protein